MATIKPTFTLVSNASSASSCAGPLSIGLNLTAQPLVDGGATGCYGISITTVKSGQLTPGTSAQALFTDAAQTEGDTAGTHGSFVYIKNTSPGDHDVSFGFLASGTDPTAAEVYGSGSLGTRVGTLKQGEFMWLPYDFAGDITVDAEDAAATIEWWLFSRT